LSVFDEPTLGQISENNEPIYTVDGLSSDGQVWLFGIPKRYTVQMRERGTLVRLVQLIGIVAPGLITARHIFRGLNRPLCEGENMHGDKTKLIYAWKPIYDYDWDEPQRFHPDEIKQRPAPGGKVFVVTGTPNQEKSKYPSIDCWLNRWNWVDESPKLSGAPIDYDTRYLEQLK
jgi:hypothetical protein